MNKPIIKCSCKKIEDMNKTEIAAEIKRLEDKRVLLEQEMFRIDDLQQALETVLENWRDVDSTDGVVRLKPKRGRILEKVLDVVSQSTGRMSTQGVLEALRQKGVRSTGNQKNFQVTVSKSLRRLTQLGKITEDRSEPNRVFYLAKTEVKTPASKI